MAIQPRFRVAAALGALIAPLAVVATTGSTADAAVSKHKHEVSMYKVEKNIKLKGVGTNTIGDSESQSLSCTSSSDYVLDGMWMVSHVDQYNPPDPEPADPDDDTGYTPVSDPAVTPGQYNDERDVWVQSSYSPLNDWDTWKFKLKNKAYGDAQVKLYITCIKGLTEKAGPSSHQHRVRVRQLFGGGADTHALSPTRFYVRTDQEPWGTCAPDEFLVAPGFDLPFDTYRLVATYPWNTSAPGRSWVWQFGTEAPVPAQIGVYGRCIDRRVFDGVAPGGTARHAIAMKHLPSLNFDFWQQSYVPQDDPRELQYSCDQDYSAYHGYKAMVGWFWMDDSGTNWEHNWFLGMEPRPKTRVYKFWNHHPSSALVKYGTLCINSRTGNPIS